MVGKELSMLEHIGIASMRGGLAVDGRDSTTAHMVRQRRTPRHPS